MGSHCGFSLCVCAGQSCEATTHVVICILWVSVMPFAYLKNGIMTLFLDALWEILNRSPLLDTVSVTFLIYNKNKVRNTGFILSCSSRVQPIRAREVMAAGAWSSCHSHLQPGSRDGQTLVLFLAFPFCPVWEWCWPYWGWFFPPR